MVRLAKTSMWIAGLLVVEACTGSSSADPKTTGTLFSIDVQNQSADTVRSTGIHVDLVRIDEPFILVDGDEVLEIQKIDQNDNGIPDRLYFTTDLDPHQSKQFVAVAGDEKELVERTRLVAEVNGSIVQDGYMLGTGAWLGGGIILENEVIGYRMHTESPYAIDVLGKRQRKLISDFEDLTQNEIHAWGGDVLDEGNSLGIGNLALYDQAQIVPLYLGTERQISIVSSGPLYAEVQIIVRGVPVRGELLDVQLNWSMESGKHWTEVSARILTKTNLTIQFAFGAPRHPDATDFTQGLLAGVHFAYTYGLQSSEGEQLGLAVMVPDSYEIETYREDPDNYFYLATPIDWGVEYRMISAWGKGQLAIYDEVMFMDLIKEYVAEYGAAVDIGAKF